MSCAGKSPVLSFHMFQKGFEGAGLRARAGPDIWIVSYQCAVEGRSIHGTLHANVASQTAAALMTFTTEMHVLWW